MAWQSAWPDSCSARRRSGYCWGRQKRKSWKERWHTCFVDALGHGGLLGQVEGRTIADVLAWFATTDLDWRTGIGPESAEPYRQNRFLPEVSGMTISGIRTAYGMDEITEVAREVHREPNRRTAKSPRQEAP
ncbi:hypothetical protein [Streptomyces pristinaespiralis]|uniref:hypothetical protein n=1 Tax=Streptomyces pristinaespiralis TaxID=38300 RepID=UPI0033C4D6BA